MTELRDMGPTGGGVASALQLCRVAEVAEAAQAHCNVLAKQAQDAVARLQILEGRIPAQSPEWKRQYELLAKRMNDFESGRAVAAVVAPQELAHRIQNLAGRLTALECAREDEVEKRRDNGDDDITDDKLRGYTELVVNGVLYVAQDRPETDETERDRDLLVALLRRCRSLLVTRSNVGTGGEYRKCYHSLMADLEETLADLEE